MIPKPAFEHPDGSFIRIPTCFVSSDAKYGNYLSYLNSYTAKLCQEQCISTNTEPLSLQLNLSGIFSPHSEAYELCISPTAITINANSSTGISHAFQSLLQLIYLAAVHHQGSLACTVIRDFPAYNYRGLHLDVSRHFFELDFIYEYLNWMEALKLNKFHWHLCDDQGWRIESKLYPLLTEIGAWRTEGDSRYGGFYTQEQISAVVTYASSMGIEIIPEIDIPGHAMAILAAYPNLACFPSSFQPLSCWGISEDILCAGKDEVLRFLTRLFTEIAALFPGKYIHIGGDEVPKQRWKACPACQQRISEHDLRDEEQLQSWLIKQLQIPLSNLGKTIIGWDEILDGNIDSEPIVMVWRGDGKDAARKAVQNGNRLILCPNHFLYFDWMQHSRPGEQGAHGISTLENVYSFNPRDCAPEAAELLLGAQANVWTEHMHNPEEVRYMVFPRLYALAELLWAALPQRDIEDLNSRIKQLEGYL